MPLFKWLVVVCHIVGSQKVEIRKNWFLTSRSSDCHGRYTHDSTNFTQCNKCSHVHLSPLFHSHEGSMSGPDWHMKSRIPGVHNPPRVCPTASGWAYWSLGLLSSCPGSAHHRHQPLQWGSCAWELGVRQTWEAGGVIERKGQIAWESCPVCLYAL